MSKLSEHKIYADGQPVPIISWVDGANHRHYINVDLEFQLKYALKIARIENTADREMMLHLLAYAALESKTIEKMKAEFVTLHKALIEIDQSLNSKPILS